MVLDSVIDPALSFNQITAGQADGFEGILNAFFTWCAGTAGLRRGTPAAIPTRRVAGAAQHRGDITGAGRGGSVAGAGQLYDALLEDLYPRRTGPSSARRWPTTRPATGHRPSPSRTLQHGGSDNADDAATAIDCLDHPVSRDLASYGALAESLQASAPVFGPLLAWGEAGCAVWPVPPTRPVGPVAAPGAPPILVVGTTNDPATPYAWAVSVAKELDRGVLLTHDGDDHVAYFYSALRPRLRPDLPGQWADAPGGSRLHLVATVGDGARVHDW